MNSVGAFVLPGFTWGAAGVWGIFAFLVGIAIKTAPVWRQKINDARKIELDASSDLRKSLLKRIEDLEQQVVAERHDGDERHDRCEEIVRGLRTKLDGVVRQFIAFQVAVGRAIPPGNVSAEVSSALQSLQQLLDPEEPAPSPRKGKDKG